MEISRIIELSKNKAFTEEEKSEIREAAESAGLDIKFGGKCPNCYTDALAILRGRADQPIKPANSGKYTYLRNEPMMWNGTIIDQHTDESVIDEFVKYFPEFYKLND